jgi:NitT/TauT family transport system substrate-binding protein
LIEAGARTLFDSSQIPGEIVDLLIVREELIDRRAGQLQTLVDAFFRARTELIENPDVWAEKLAGRESLTPQAYLAALDQVILPDPDSNREMLSGTDPPMARRLNSVAGILRNIGVIQEIPDFGDAIEGRFVRNAGS